MASGTDLQTLREDITCSICLDPMTEPVNIDCGHIFCRSCIMKFLKNSKRSLPISLEPPSEIFHCPVCRAEFPEKSIRPMKQLKSLINIVKKLEQERLCEEHGEQLHLFCEDDDQLICWRCEWSPQHKGHAIVLVEDAGKKYRVRPRILLQEKFQKSLMKLRKLQEKNKQCQVNTKEEIEEWKRETRHKESDFHSNFRQFCLILHEEKKSYLWQLEKVKEDVLQRLQDSEDILEKQSQELSDHILELERKCQGPAQDLLQGVRDTWNRISALKLHEPEDVSLDIDIMCKVPGCFSKLRETVETYEVSITLDSDTAHEDLDVNVEKCSVNNTVTGTSREKKNFSPKRFTELPCILGQQIFTSGSHFFKVTMIKGPEWNVGVCLENVLWYDDGARDPKSGFWAIGGYNGYYVALTSDHTPLPIQREIESLCIFLNYENGLVSFYDFDHDSHLFTFPKASFSGPLRAYFRIGKGTSMTF